MNNTISSSLKALFVLSLTFFCTESYSQIKIFSNEHVQIGPYWGGTPAHNMMVNGTGHFNCYPAQYGGFFIQNYPNATFNEPIILPNVSHNMWLGNNNSRLWRVYSHGVYYGAGGLNSYCDQRLKTNIQQLSDFNAISKITSIKTYRFDYTAEAFPNTPEEKLDVVLESGKNQIGVMAQEIQEVYPEAVNYDSEADLFTVDYTTIIPLLIEAIKEQQEQIETLQAIINE